MSKGLRFVPSFTLLFISIAITLVSTLSLVNLLGTHCPHKLLPNLATALQALFSGPLPVEAEKPIIFLGLRLCRIMLNLIGQLLS